MKIAIIGAGAAGCFAAANIKRVADAEVAVYEKTGKALQKVKISGGGRCNVTHQCFDIPELVDRYPRGKQLLRRTLHRFGPEQTIDWFAERGVTLKAEEDGRMFPVTDDSQTIIDCLWKEMMRRGVSVHYHKAVTGITPTPESTHKFSISFADGSSASADKVLITTGGYPKADQYNWLAALGHAIVPPVPSLFTFNVPKHPISALMGLSVPDAAVKVAGSKAVQRGPVLITHWGFSGPAVLRTSAIAARELAACNYHFRVVINWLGDAATEDFMTVADNMRRTQGTTFVANKNPFGLPKRLWEYMMPLCGILPTTRWADLPAGARNKLAEQLLRDAYEVAGKTTFKEEFVTSGGISIAEIDAHTMQSRKQPGIYFAGEIIDVDGITGGYNFQHAWSSGWVVAQAMQA